MVEFSLYIEHPKLSNTINLPIQSIITRSHNSKPYLNHQYSTPHRYSPKIISYNPQYPTRSRTAATPSLGQQGKHWNSLVADSSHRSSSKDSEASSSHWIFLLDILLLWIFFCKGPYSLCFYFVSICTLFGLSVLFLVLSLSKPSFVAYLVCLISSGLLSYVLCKFCAPVGCWVSL